MNRLLNEERITLAQMAKLVHTTVRTIQDWIGPGTLNRKTGERIVLESMIEAGRRKTSEAAYRRYLERLNADKPAKVETRAERRAPRTESPHATDAQLKRLRTVMGRT